MTSSVENIPRDGSSEDEEPRLVSKELQKADEPALERSLRPRCFEEFTGQPRLKEQLQLSIQAARARGEALDHVLLYGPPGLGKTTLAHVIAEEMGVGIHITAGPILEKRADLAGILTNLEPSDVLFVDEIHRMSRVVEESLYPAMEDYLIDIIVDQGPHGRSIQIPLPRFTLVGATTRTGMLTSPLRDRFPIVHRLQFYEKEDLIKIITRSAGVLDVDIHPDGAREIAHRCRRTPRIANRLLARVRDYTQVRADGKINASVTLAAMELLQVDELGLDETDRLLLETLIDKFDGGPVGLKALSVAINEEPETVEEVFEPFLIQIGFLNRTPQGRTATRRAFEHLGRPGGNQPATPTNPSQAELL